MFGQSSPRHVVLVSLFVVWLASQPLVVGLSPAWGAILPHEHLTRGILTAEQWQAHLREHLGIARVAETQVCVQTHASAGSSVFGSVPDSSGLLTDFGQAVNLQDAIVRIPAIAPAQARVVETALQVADRAYPPLTPPPNA